ncbi:carboxymuconolactone decarboxylase family protein [Saprospiraceae bacterium]|nr:carboxymuconolactone decarboxylase family protein [Saprospiraceae bacterium]
MTYKEKYSQINKSLQKIGGERPDFMINFGSLHKYATANSSLNRKNRELIALGISISTQCDKCICFHMHDCFEAGASRDEIMDCIEVAVLMGGGPALMYATQAYDAMNEYYPPV